MLKNRILGSLAAPLTKCPPSLSDLFLFPPASLRATKSPPSMSSSVAAGSVSSSTGQFFPFCLTQYIIVILYSVIATSFTNGVSDGHKFKTRSQMQAVEQFNRANALGEVKICPPRTHRP